MGILAGLQNPRSIPALLAAYIIEAIYPDSTEIAFTIAKDLLPDTYKGNPSLFAAKVLEKLAGEWLDSSGFQTPHKRTHVTIVLFRKAKPSHARRAHPAPSLKQTVKLWLDLNLHKARKLRIPLIGVPPFYASHPEQLTYAIKKETKTPIRIRRMKTSWMISRC